MSLTHVSLIRILCTEYGTCVWQFQTLTYNYRTINLSSQVSFKFWTQTFIVYFWILLNISKSSWIFQNVMLKNQLFWWDFFFAKVTEYWDIRFLSILRWGHQRPVESKEIYSEAHFRSPYRLLLIKICF